MSKDVEEDVISEKKCISCEQKLEHVSDVDTCKVVDSGSCDINVCCANCGRDGGVSNKCNKCKLGTY